MSSEIIEYVYNNRDNTIDLLLKADGVAVDLSQVTRMAIRDNAGNIIVDESISPGAFSYPTSVTGKVLLSLGGEGLSAGSYKVQLILYDPVNTSGIVWNNEYINILVR